MQTNNSVRECEKIIDEDIIKHLKKSEEDIKNGRTIPAKKVFEELRAEYRYK